MVDKTAERDMSISLEFAQKIKNQNRRDKITKYSSAIVLLGLIAVFAVIAPGFFSLTNMMTILTQIATPLVLALGLTFVVLTGSIDLSDRRNDGIGWHGGGISGG